MLGIVSCTKGCPWSSVTEAQHSNVARDVHLRVRPAHARPSPKISPKHLPVSRAGNAVQGTTQLHQGISLEQLEAASNGVRADNTHLKVRLSALAPFFKFRITPSLSPGQ